MHSTFHFTNAPNPGEKKGNREPGKAGTVTECTVVIVTHRLEVQVLLDVTFSGIKMSTAWN